jgi:hypothetical protein
MEPMIVVTRVTNETAKKYTDWGRCPVASGSARFATTMMMKRPMMATPTKRERISTTMLAIGSRLLPDDTRADPELVFVKVVETPDPPAITVLAGGALLKSACAALIICPPTFPEFSDTSSAAPTAHPT